MLEILFPNDRSLIFIFNKFHQFFSFGLELINFVILAAFFLVQKSNDDVFDAVTVIIDGQVVQVPVLDDKEQVGLDSDLVNHWLSDIESVTHDSYKHVQKMNDHQKSCDKEDEVQSWLGLVAVISWCVLLTKVIIEGEPT